MPSSPFSSRVTEAHKYVFFLPAIQEASDWADNSSWVSRFLNQCWWCRKEGSQVAFVDESSLTKRLAWYLAFFFFFLIWNKAPKISQGKMWKDIERPSLRDCCRKMKPVHPPELNTRAASLVGCWRAKDLGNLSRWAELTGNQELGETSRSPLNYDTTFLTGVFQYSLSSPRDSARLPALKISKHLTTILAYRTPIGVGWKANMWRRLLSG